MVDEQNKNPEIYIAKNWIEYNDTINLEQEFKKTEIPIVLYFSANWCGPCKLMGPELEEKLGTNMNFKVFKINVDKYEDISNEYNVSVLPTFHIIHKGNEIETFCGSKDDLIEKLCKKISSLI